MEWQLNCHSVHISPCLVGDPPYFVIMEGGFSVPFKGSVKIPHSGMTRTGWEILVTRL